MRSSYVQEVTLYKVQVPTIDGFQCPAMVQDAEQNALFKAILFSPWACTDVLSFGSPTMFTQLFSNGCSHCGDCSHTTQPSLTGTALSSSSSAATQMAAKKFTFR